MEKGEGEDTESTEGRLLHFFSYMMVCIAFAREKFFINILNIQS